MSDKISRRQSMSTFGALIAAFGASSAVNTAVASNREMIEAPKIIASIKRLLIDIEHRKDGIYGKYLTREGTIELHLIIGIETFDAEPCLEAGSGCGDGHELTLTQMQIVKVGMCGSPTSPELDCEECS